MFHIISPDGLTVTEAGCKTIFVPKDHEEYDTIVENINTLSYWEIFSKTDVKTKMQSLIDDKTEAYFNENDDFEVCLSNLKDAHKEDLSHLVMYALEDVITNRGGDAKEVEDMKKLVSRLSVSKVKIIFE